jgi:four helix bundle protein
MEKYKDFRDMPVWQKAFALLLKVYIFIKKFPIEEKFALADDLRRSANSVVHNIAEGYGRYEPKDKTRFYKISRGSSHEAMSQLLVANALNYITTSETEEMISGYKVVIEELNALIHKLEPCNR